MAVHFNANLSAVRANNNFAVHYKSLQRSINKLTTGLKINSSEDDPANYAVRQVMRADTLVYKQGILNAEIAMNALKTAESAMDIIDQKLIRMKELAEQASTSTYTKTQRMILHSEFISMGAEIDRIAKATDFTEIKLIDGSLSTRSYENYLSSIWMQKGMDGEIPDFLNNSGQLGLNGGMKVHFGLMNSRNEDYYFINCGNMTLDGLLKSFGNPNVSANRKISLSTQVAAQTTLVTIQSALESKESGRAHIGAMMNRLESTIKNLSDQSFHLEEAESVISDIDVAEEMTNYTKSQMLSQAATSIMTQANMIPQLALKLLNA